jgi:predicted outer membrane repeat protein
VRIPILKKFFFAFLISVCLPAVVLAAAIQVNDLSDNATADNDLCTLREAITNANSDSDTTLGDCAAGSGTDIISFSVTGTITLVSGQLEIDSDLSISGPGADMLTISGNDSTRVFKVEVAEVNLSGLTISNGATGQIGDENGGGINNAGSLTVSDSSFSDNRAGGSGGAIYNEGTLIVTNSAFLTNSAHLSGGAIHNSGTLDVTNSTFWGNSGDGGGAIYSAGPAATITNSTISGNSSLDFFGAAIFGQSEIILSNSIIANTTNSRNCNGIITDGGNNLQFASFSEAPSGCPESIPTPATDPLGGNAPDDNGGPTQTIALPSGSPAIDAYSNNGCGTTITTDQRGEPRPADGNGDSIATCDIGAFEVQPPPPCPSGKGFWKNHPADWPVTSLTLGDVQYTQAELLFILGSPTKKDASLILAKQLIAAKLNVANGSDDSVLTLIAEADSLLAPFSGKLPYSVKPSSPTGQSMVSVATQLESYNKGLLTDGCHP